MPYGHSYNEKSRANDLALASALANQTLSLSNGSDTENNETLTVYPLQKQITVPPVILVITVVAIIISDFCADGLQNPSRAYLLDVCPEGREILIARIILIFGVRNSDEHDLVVGTRRTAISLESSTVSEHFILNL